MLCVEHHSRRVGLRSCADEGRVTRLLEAMHELSVDRAVAERAGRIRREANVRLPDALIAATAIEHGLTLLTRNRRDFDAVAGLSLGDALNP